jgi:hypothetical protein
LIGAGFGTFLPRYYIFDDQWVLLLVELGVLGVLCFAGIFLAAVGSTVHAGRLSGFEDTVRLCRGLAASMFAITVLFAFFDALSFPISAGLFFLVAGLCGATLTVGKGDSNFPRSTLLVASTN